MKRWIPQIPAPPPQRWQSRQEILNKYLDSLSPDDLLRTRPYHWALRYGPGGYARKYDPNQPRVPAGNSDGGQWTGGASGGNSERTISNPLESFAAARRRGRSEAYCSAQYLIDGLLCRSVRPASRAAACWKQASERYANCLAGRQIPPLNY